MGPPGAVVPEGALARIAGVVVERGLDLDYDAVERAGIKNDGADGFCSWLCRHVVVDELDVLGFGAVGGSELTTCGGADGAAVRSEVLAHVLVEGSGMHLVDECHASSLWHELVRRNAVPKGVDKGWVAGSTSGSLVPWSLPTTAPGSSIASWWSCSQSFRR